MMSYEEFGRYCKTVEIFISILTDEEMLANAKNLVLLTSIENKYKDIIRRKAIEIINFYAEFHEKEPFNDDDYQIEVQWDDVKRFVYDGATIYCTYCYRGVEIDKITIRQYHFAKSDWKEQERKVILAQKAEQEKNAEYQQYLTLKRKFEP